MACRDAVGASRVLQFGVVNVWLSGVQWLVRQDAGEQHNWLVTEQRWACADDRDEESYRCRVCGRVCWVTACRITGAGRRGREE